MRSIPSIDLTAPAWFRSWALAVKEMLETRENTIPNGDIRKKTVTYQELIDLGLITKDDLPS